MFSGFPNKKVTVANSTIYDVSMTDMQSSTSTNTQIYEADGTTSFFISVVVPIRNEERFIASTLDALLEQDYPDNAFEILVVDGESTDATRDIVTSYAERFPNVHLLHNPKKWSSAARNLGVTSAQGDAIVIVDGHCEFVDNKYLRNVEKAFLRPDIDCLGRPQCLEVSNGNSLQQAIAAARSSRLGHHPDSFIYSDEERLVPAHSVAVAYRKSVFDAVGMFDESFDACEDVEFNHRIDKAGLTCLLAPDILLRYYPRASLKGLFRQMARYGRGRVRLFRKHAETLSLKSFVPAVFICFLLLGGVAAALLPILQLPYFMVIAAYVGIVLYFSAATAIKERRLRLLWLLPCVFGAIHFGAGYGSLKELLFGKMTSDKLDR